MGISNNKNSASGCNQTDYAEHFCFTCKRLSAIWECVEEKVYRKFEIKLKLIVNDVLFGYKGHSQPFTINRFINHLILVAKMCKGIFKHSTPLEIKFVLDRELNVRSIK